ncbi:hypothetical protein NKR19_g4350 [Coniochaeta hoffmannii]|uniref:Allergen Asp f 4 n=1 Tax=Coniochaeta hoffmannii TaxID=91930 RepID=A0AA38RPL9_9PEZI|nr:hypothetical protein NKR19_g4350 [Coniochaeta hoffmannii]
MQLTSLFVLGAALGAMAAPSHHAHSHAHRSVHERAVYYKGAKGKVGTPASTTTSSAAAPAATTASAAPAAASSASSSAAAPAFCQGKSKRATLADITSVGNTGTADNYGCNIMVVDNSLVNKYDYTAQYTNVADEPYEVVLGLKIGRTGLVNGFFDSVTSFMLQPGETKTVAYEEDTQGWAAFAPNSVPKTTWGQWGGVWAEYDYASKRNNLWSGADCSSLVAASQPGLEVPGCMVCDADDASTCSKIFPGGAGVNAFIAGTAEQDGLGINKKPGPLHLHVAVGYNA